VEAAMLRGDVSKSAGVTLDEGVAPLHVAIAARLYGGEKILFGRKQAARAGKRTCR
jgi:hypothetical protein